MYIPPHADPPPPKDSEYREFPPPTEKYEVNVSHLAEYAFIIGEKYQKKINTK